MIALSITSGTATYSVTDSGTTGYVLEAWNPGLVSRDNTYATSRWIDGGALTSSRKDILTMEGSIQSWGTSTTDAVAKANTLGSALGAFSYTITESGAGAATYTCMPADYRIEYNPAKLRGFLAVITVSIPRQP